MVECDHKTAFVHDLECHERSDAKVLVLEELRPPATNAHCWYSCAHIGEKPEFQWPLLHRADRGQQGAILFARPPCLGSEGRRNLLRYTNPSPAVRMHPTTYPIPSQTSRLGTQSWEDRDLEETDSLNLPGSSAKTKRAMWARSNEHSPRPARAAPPAPTMDPP